METGVKELKGGDKVQKVVLDNGEEIDADIVIVGVGVNVASGFLKESTGI